MDVIILVTKNKKCNIKILPKHEIEGTTNYRMMLNFLPNILTVSTRHHSVPQVWRLFHMKK